MPRPAFLHIQSSDRATQVVPLTVLAVRIGRGPQCEVRLDEPGLAEVQCLLRRRGESWHVQPVGPAGMIAIDGRPVESQRLWAPGAPLRVGSHWLTMRRGGESADAIGSFESPITVAPISVSRPAPASSGPESLAARPYAEPTPTDARRTADAEEDRLRRWEAQLRQRERWLEARREERRWEARWRAAGEALRARSSAGSKGHGTSPTPSKSTGPGSAESPHVGSTPIHIARPRSKSSADDLAAKAAGGDHPESPADIVESNPPAPPDEPPSGDGISAAVDPEVNDFRAGWDSDLSADGTVIAVSTAPEPVDPPAGVGAEAVLAPPLDEEAPEVANPPVPEAQPPNQGGGISPDDVPTRPRAKPSPIKLGTVIREEPACRVEDQGPIGTVGDGRGSPWSAHSPIWPGSERITTGPVDSLRPFLGGGTLSDDLDRRPLADPPASKRESDSPANGDDPAIWPSASRILKGTRRGGREKAVHPSRRRAEARPQPTRRCPPGHWSLPLGLVWLPAMLVVLGLGSAGIVLGWIWAQDDRVAGIIADRVLAAGSLPETPVADLSAAPAPAWWGSTARHLYLRALAEAAVVDDPESEDRVRFLIGLGRGAAPLLPEIRHASLRPGRDGEGREPLGRLLGQSRDIVTLASMGRVMNDAGEVEVALRAYRAALEMASEIEAERCPSPSFDEDRRVERYTLPGEDLIAEVVGGMARLDWPFAEWSKALPPSPVSALAAYRVLRGLGRPEAEQALDFASGEGNDGAGDAVALAARAELRALRERWEEADELYRRAVGQIRDERIRRTWWFNLASIAMRQGDPSKAEDAWEKAKSSRPGDEINRRVAEAQIRSSVGAGERDSGPSSTGGQGRDSD